MNITKDEAPVCSGKNVGSQPKGKRYLSFGCYLYLLVFFKNLKVSF
jgi:hypothetical protein